MNNEERILSMLEQLQHGQAVMQGDIAEMKGDIAELKTDVAGLKADMVEVKQRVTKIEMIQENVTNKQIGLLIDGHIGVVDKLRALEDLPERVEDIQMTVSILKHAVSKA